MAVKSNKKSASYQENGVEVERRAVQNKLGDLVLQLNTFLMFPLAVYLGAVKTIGMANTIIKPSFSFGFFFDDAFLGTAPFLALFLAWNAPSFYFYSDKARALLTIAAYYMAIVVGVVFTASFDFANLCVAAYAGMNAAVNLVAYSRYVTQEADLKPKSVDAPVPRLYIAIMASIFLGLFVLRVLLGVEELAGMPNQPQIIASPLIVVLFMLAALHATKTEDVQVLRAFLQTFCVTAILLSAFFNIKPGFMVTVLTYAARLAAGAAIYIYTQKPMVNGIISQYKGVIARVTRLGNVEGYGDE